jgi:hypothetical protein
MRKRKERNTKSTELLSGGASGSAQRSAIAGALVAGTSMPDHELTVVGVGNITRRFDLDEPSNGPTVIFRTAIPFANFINGFSATETDGWSEGDTGAATDITVTDVTQALYPVTNMASAAETDVWPVLLNLFSSGTGVRHSVTFSEFVRYQAMLLEAYNRMLTPLVVNHLAFHFDWTKVFPFSGVVPNFLYTLATNLDATDVGLADRWLPLMKRFESKIAFPRMIAEIKRQLTPMLSIDLNGRLLINSRYAIDSAVADDVESEVQGFLDYIEIQLASASSLFSSFLPFPLKDMNPWAFNMGPSIDVDRESGWFNSPTKQLGVFNDTGDPVISEVMLFDEATGSTSLYYTRHTQPIWAELRHATMYELTDDVTDDKFRLVSPHWCSRIHILDDAFDVFSYTGVQIDDASVGFRYIDYADCRFASKDVDYGTQKPGLLGAEIQLAPINRLMRIETDYQFSIEILKVVTANMAGASLRELRYTIQSLVQESMRSSR